MASKLPFSEEEMTVDDGLGYPKAYSQLCRTPSLLTPYNHGPPSVFVPYVLSPQEALREKELNQMFPVIDPETKHTANPRGYVNLLWKQLDHLGNAGFDPALFRVDTYGNVLYLHADSASPLAWDIDHWFPCSRGGRTVPSNLRLLQWQVCRKKQNKLELLIPWWDLQLGISVNQFLSVFSSRNADFRNRAFSFLFSNGGSEELSALQAVESHSFPQHFIHTKRQVGLAPAAIVSSQKSTDSSVLKTLDLNRTPRHNSVTNVRKFSAGEDDASMVLQLMRPNTSKENERPNADGYTCNPHLAITMARDSLRQREEVKKKQEEITRVEEELVELKQKNESERRVLQDLEEVLIKRRRRVEKCRRLAEAQSSYRSLLEKMIRDAMHQCVIYKEQLRLNQAASSALMARLEAQRAMADSSENELRRKFKQRDEVEKETRHCWEKPRKRSRMDDILFEERNNENIHFSTTRAQMPPKKELRELLEEAQKASAENSLGYYEEEEEEEEEEKDARLRSSATREGNWSRTRATKNSSPFHQSHQEEGKGRWRTLVASKGEISLVEEEEEKDARLRSSATREGNWSRTRATKNSSPFHQSHQDEGKGRWRTLVASKGEISLVENTRDAPEGSCSNKNVPSKKNMLFQRPHEADEEDRQLIDSNCEISLNNKLEKLAIRSFEATNDPQKSQPPHSSRSGGGDDDEEYRKRAGKGNVENWLQILLENAEGSPIESPPMNTEGQENQTEETVHQLGLKNSQIENKPLDGKSGFDEHQTKSRNFSKKGKNENVLIINKHISENSNDVTGVESTSICNGVASRKSFEVKERRERKGKDPATCESGRGFRSLPSSPSAILGMRRGTDCMRKKPNMISDEDDDSVLTNRFIKTCTKAIKKVMNK